MIEGALFSIWGVGVAGIVMMFVTAIVTLIASLVDPRIKEGDEQ